MGHPPAPAPWHLGEVPQNASFDDPFSRPVAGGDPKFSWEKKRMEKKTLIAGKNSFVGHMCPFFFQKMYQKGDVHWFV